VVILSRANPHNPFATQIPPLSPLSLALPLVLSLAPLPLSASHPPSNHCGHSILLPRISANQTSG